MKVLILQNGVSHYRIPFYNSLSEYAEITVLFDGPSVDYTEKKFNEVRLQGRNVLGFRVHGNLRRYCSGFDCIIVMFDLRWLSFVRLGLRNPNAVFWSHCLGRNEFLNRLRLLLLRKAPAILAYTKPITDRLLASGLPAEKLFYNENTVHVSSPFCSNYRYRKSLLYTGRCQERKKLEDAITAFEAVADQLPVEVNFVVVGPGFSGMERRVRTTSSHASRIRFLGPIHDEELLADILSDGIAYISPGHVGLGVLHAFAYGVPVITYKNEEHAPEFHNCRDGINSLLVETVSEIGNAMISLVSDRSFGKKLSSAAFSLYTKERTVEKMAQRTLEAINYAAGRQSDS